VVYYSLWCFRYTLEQQGEWIFAGLLQGELLEYVVTLCTIFRLLAAPAQTEQSVQALARLGVRFQYLHRKLLPPPCRPLQFHRLSHAIESIKVLGPVFIYWCFRSERVMGRLVKMLRRRHRIEAHLAVLLRRIVFARQICGLTAAAENALQEFVRMPLCLVREPLFVPHGTDPELAVKEHQQRSLNMAALATRISSRRERLGYRINVDKFPEGSPLVVSDWRTFSRKERTFLL